MERTIRTVIATLAAAILCLGARAQVNDPSLMNKVMQARFVAKEPVTASLGLLHYSDLHGDDAAAAELLGFISGYAPYIDAVVNTGDAVHYYAEGTKDYPNDASWWRASGLAEKSLYVLGNHDGSVKSDAHGHLEGSSDWDFKGQEWDFDTFFADYAGTLGITLPDGYDKKGSRYYKSCFWYKDFPDAKIRIIGLDCVHFDDDFHHVTSEQEEWLAARLAETLDGNSKVSGYSVVILNHYPIDDYNGDDKVWDEASHGFAYNNSPTGGRVIDHRTGDVTNFHSYSRKAYDADKRFTMKAKVRDGSEKYGYRKGEANPLADIVQAWVDEGGKFVAWLCGHCHADLFFYPERYPGLLCVAVDQAGNLRGNNLTDREGDPYFRTCANFYGIDTQHGLIKVVRMGLPMDRLMIRKDVLCYDYVKKKVIYE